VRRAPLWILLSLTACSTGPIGLDPRPSKPPDQGVVRALLPGTRLHTEIARGLPDEPLYRAAAVWWHQALRQSRAFELADGQTPPEGLALVLAIDPVGRRLSAFLRQTGEQRLALAGGAYEAEDLPGGIDRIAWAARMALGEEVMPPVPVAAAVSPSPRATDAAADGFVLLHDGAVEASRRAFLLARRSDGGSPFVLDGLARVALLRSDAEVAERLCREALGYRHRLSPMTQHSLTRTLLFARASRTPEQAPERDRELLALGLAMQRERPHDPQGLLTIAIAENLLGLFADARPRLESLRRRLPRTAIVDYHLGWACLATDDAGEALAAFDEAALRLPPAWVVIPRILAYYALGDDSGLDRLLARQLRELGPRDFGLAHELYRIQAAHALLCDEPEQCADHILTDLNWMLAHPTLLDYRPGQLAEQGEVLVRLGRIDELPAILAAMQAQHPTSMIADACAYVSGLISISLSRQRDITLEDRLGRGGESVFALRLQAFGHEVRGELADMHAALARAARLSDSPLTKSLLARSLRIMGRVEEARSLRDALRRELTTINLRRRPNHPLLGPEIAFAYLLD